MLSFSLGRSLFVFPALIQRPKASDQKPDHTHGEKNETSLKKNRLSIPCKLRARHDITGRCRDSNTSRLRSHHCCCHKGDSGCGYQHSCRRDSHVWPNDHHQRCEPAAEGFRIVAGLNGLLASAAWPLGHSLLTLLVNRIRSRKSYPTWANAVSVCATDRSRLSARRTDR